MHFFTITIIIYLGFILLLVNANNKGVPDPRTIKEHTSRGSGTGPIYFLYAIVAVIAFSLFVIGMGLIICYKKERGIRNKEKTLFLTAY